MLKVSYIIINDLVKPYHKCKPEAGMLLRFTTFKVPKPNNII